MGNLSGIGSIEAETPQVFARAFATPPGLPWDQARAAQLEARHGSPLPIADLLHRVQRLEPWALGAGGRYAVFYVRRRDYAKPFETTVDVEGVSVRVAFGTSPDRFRRLRAVALGVGAAFLVVAAVGAPLSLALAARAEAEARLAAVEQKIDVRARQAARSEADVRRSLGLIAARGDAGAPSDVLADLAWISRAKLPDARITAVHWEHGLMAIEARGDTQPVAPLGRRIQRSQKPLRPGIWLWGVAPEPAAAVDAPVAAEMRAP